MNESRWMTGEWARPEYQQDKKQNFDILTQHLTESPINLLDIGCGLAWESRLIENKYGTNLWLLDGDVTANSDKPSYSSEIKYHNSTEDFLFYHSLDTLDKNLKQLGTKNYTLVDCNNIQIPENIKFDLITSWLSCGFHYPVSTYKDLILKHSHENTKIIVDLRIHIKTKEVFLEEGVKIVNILGKYSKHINAEIKFI